MKTLWRVKSEAGSGVRWNMADKRYIHEAKSDRDYLRQVEIDGYVLRTWDTGRRTGNVGAFGKPWLGYVFEDIDGSVLFTGEDFGCSPCHAIDSDEAVRSLLGFLTLRPGDTDSEYFEKYNDAQFQFAENEAEALQMYAMEESDNPPPLVNLDDWEA